MRFDLTEPCRHCPFRNDETRITFGNRERAAEIEESAYRHGFPCHVSAECAENPRTGEEGFVFGADTQHCAGYILVQLHENPGDPWPGIGDDEELAERLAGQVNWDAPVFGSTDEFLDANTTAAERADQDEAVRGDRRPGSTSSVSATGSGSDQSSET